MKRLENGDYLVPAVHSSDAIDLVLNQVDVPTICALNINPLDSAIWLVQPYYRGHESGNDDSLPVDPDYVQLVTPKGWSVTIDTRLGLLVIRSETRALHFVQTFSTSYVSRSLFRSSFAKLGMVVG